MEYPKEFVDAAKKAFPEWKVLHGALDTGSPAVGHILSNAKEWRPSPKSILDALDQGRTEDIRKEAERHTVAHDLFVQWSALLVPKKND